VESVRLYDAGDAIRVSVFAPAAGTYRIGARVRSGGTFGSTGFWPDGYRFRLDGASLTLAGDVASISIFDLSYGGCYWGTMQSDVLTLSAGTHVVEITATYFWAVADYVELTQMNP